MELHGILKGLIHLQESKKSTGAFLRVLAKHQLGFKFCAKFLVFIKEILNGSFTFQTF